MDDNLLKDGEVIVDIESCRILSEEVGSSGTVSDGKVGDLVHGENRVNLVGSTKSGSEVSPKDVKVLISKEVEGVNAANLAEFNKIRNERRKSSSAKKPPKPPRPPRGLSLDAADQKLIKEIAELAMMKRARIERMKALKKMKTAKASWNSSSSGTFFAFLCTILFCLVIVFQGMSCRDGSSSSSHGSPESTQLMESLIVVQDHKSMATNDTSYVGSDSPKLLERVSGLNP